MSTMKKNNIRVNNRMQLICLKHSEMLHRHHRIPIEIENIGRKYDTMNRLKENHLPYFFLEITVRDHGHLIVGVIIIIVIIEMIVLNGIDLINIVIDVVHHEMMIVDDIVHPIVAIELIDVIDLK